MIHKASKLLRRQRIRNKNILNLLPKKYIYNYSFNGNNRIICNYNKLYKISYNYFSNGDSNNNNSNVNTSQQRYFNQIQTGVIDVLRKIEYPNDPNNYDIVYKGLIKNIIVRRQNKDSRINSSNLSDEINYFEEKLIVSIELELNEYYKDLRKLIKDSVLKELGDYISMVRVHMSQEDKQSEQQKEDNRRPKGLANVKYVIAVASCKGGVGKSTCAVNLAYTLSKLGYSVGIYDSDIFGPSLPTMISPIDTTVRNDADTHMLYPIIYEGVKCMSFGYVKTGTAGSDPNTGLAIMRGPMVSGVVQELLKFTKWDYLDYLIIDMPPGTSDIHITLSQQLGIDGAIVITTPSKLSYIDVIKGIEMFDKVNIPTIGIIENMTSFICDKCNHITYPFGHGYIKQIKEQFGIMNSYSLPIYSSINNSSDNGDPIVLDESTDTNKIKDLFYNLSYGIINEIENIKINGDKLKPIWALDNENKQIKFIFENDNNNSIILAYKSFRYKCKCASCVDEFTNEQKIQYNEINNNINIQYISYKGNYAISIKWSDGHDSLFPFAKLKQIEQEIIDENL